MSHHTGCGKNVGTRRGSKRSADLFSKVRGIFSPASAKAADLKDTRTLARFYEVPSGRGEGVRFPIARYTFCMPKSSAGLVLYRVRDGALEVLLVHPGGPFWARKDSGAWTIPKGEVEPEEDQLTAARREFEEELGFSPSGEFVSLGTITQKAGKIVQAWALEGDCDPKGIKSNSFVIEWPLHSGKKQSFPEVDRAAFFGMEEAKRKINPAQVELLSRLQEAVAGKVR
jgi:predicted NUDIX family NTP pyrophosphohydrolase